MFYWLMCFALWSSAEDLETPRIYITDSTLSEEFSERVAHAPFIQTKPPALQKTSPQFENLFWNLTSVQARSSGGPATSIRGSSQAGRVLFLLDNIPLNFLDGFGGSPLFVPTEILDRIHIFEGPSSAQYGANALGGTMHFIPQMRDRPMVRVGLSETDSSYLPEEGGTLSTVNFAGVMPLINSENHQVQTSVFFEKDRGDFPFTDSNGNRQRRDNNAQTTRRFTLLGRHRVSDNWRLSHLLLYAGLKKRTPGSFILPFITDQDSHAGLAALSSQYKASGSTLWTTRLSHSFMDSNFYDPAKSVSDSGRSWLSQTFGWEFMPGYMSQTTVDVATNVYTATFVQDQKFDRTEPEIAQSFIVPLTDSLIVEPSLRYLQRYKEFVYQVNLPYEFDGGKAWLTHSSGFRPPALTDLYANTPIFVGNPDLKPETSNQWEAGMSWRFTALLVRTSIFHVDYKDLFQSTLVSPGVFTRENIGRARSYGGTISADWGMDRLLANVSYSHLIAREQPSGSILRFSPEHQAFASLTYNFESWSLTGQQTVWSHFYDLDFLNNSNAELPEWYSTDLIVNVSTEKKWNLTAGVYNIFGKRRELSFGYPEPQTRYALAVEYNF